MNEATDTKWKWVETELIKFFRADAKALRDTLVAGGMTDTTLLFRTLRAELSRKYPEISSAMHVMLANGGVRNATKPDATAMQRLGGQAHFYLANLVRNAPGRVKVVKDKDKTPRGQRGPTTKAFRDYRQVCVRFGRVPHDEMASILMGIDSDKLPEYRKELKRIGYAFEASDDGWLRVKDTKKEEMERLQTQITVLQRQMEQLQEQIIAQQL